jgi:predicted Zn-dependent protease
MRKILTQGLVMLTVFLGSWAALAQVNWVGLFRTEQVSDAAETRLGDIVWKSIERRADIVRNPAITVPLDSIRLRLCKAAEMRECPVRVYAVREKEVNAFALPGGRILVTTALLAEVRNESELAGVMAHELAHVQLRHVMNKLVKDIGLAIIVSTTAGSEVVNQVIHSLSSTAYDRRLESAADLYGVDLLMDSHINPQPFAELTYRLGQRIDDPNGELRWLSTHPSSEERALAIVERTKDADVSPVAMIDSRGWNAMKRALPTDGALGR